jgi:predicted N-acyltransferase
MRIRPIVSLEEIAAADWDRCTQWAQEPAGATPRDDARNPFMTHAFLLALEQSGSTGARTGWTAAHLVAEDEAGRIVGVAPTYLKAHSQGEYVFDHAWADAYQRAGGRYYPKLQVAAPFTPATGRRLMAAPDVDTAIVERALGDGLLALRDQMGASSAHITFQSEAEWDRMDSSWLRRFDIQYHWFNRSYATYDDFLATLQSRKRKTLKKERRDALANGVTLRQLTGPELTEAVWDDFHAFYMDTGSRKWGRPYLTRAFFSLVGQAMGDRIMLVIAEREGRRIAGAINFIGADTLYGRHWGCIEDHPFLHFEACYHQAVDFAIARGLARVEAGAQGEHKLGRGYEPVLTRSCHAIAHPGLQRAVADFLEHERRAIEAARAEMQSESPYARRREEEGD